MAFTEQERSIAKQIKEQGGSREDFLDVLGQIRSKQTEVKPVEENENISGLDIGVVTGKKISEAGKEFKTEGVEFPKTLKETAKAGIVLAKNIVPDAVEGAGEIIELASDPLGTFGALKTTAGGLVEKGLNEIFSTNIGQSILRGLGAPEGNLEKIKEGGFFTEEKKGEAANAAIKHLQDNFGTLDKATKSITENPVDSLLFIKGMLSAGKKVISEGDVSKLEKIEKSLSQKIEESAIKDVEQALGTAKEKFKQKGRELAPEIIDRGIKGSKEDVQLLAETNADKYGKQIQDFVESGKLQGTVKRDELLDVLDDIRKEGQVGDVIIDESIVNATDKFADIISEFGKEIPAEKARLIRQMFDKAVYNTKGVISEEALSLKNNIKKGLGDNIRKQLAEQNPELASINKEFNFYSKLDEVLTETLNRKGPQSGGLTGNIAGGGGLAGGAVIFGDVTGAIASAVVIKGLTEAMKSTKWKLASAGLKQKLANALASGDKTASTKFASQLIKEVLQNKANIYLGGQVLEGEETINQ